MQCSLLLKDQTGIFLCKIFVLENIGEIDSADSLNGESSSSSSNDELSSQSKVDSSSNTDSEFHGRQVLIEKHSVRNHLLKRAKSFLA